jgi:hypothetical protein
MVQSVQDGSGEIEEDAEQEWEESEEDEFWTHFSRHMEYGEMKDIFEGPYINQVQGLANRTNGQMDKWMGDEGWLCGTSICRCKHKYGKEVERCKMQEGGWRHAMP